MARTPTAIHPAASAAPQRAEHRWPGLLLAAALATVAMLLDEVLADQGITFLSAVFMAILLGLLVRQLGPDLPATSTGVRFAAKRVLKLGIILLGIRFSLVSVVETGLSSLLIIVAGITAAFVAVYLLTRFVQVPGKLALLIGVGTAICGNSAIAATAPVIGAEDEEVTFASATITLFGTLAMLLYPLIGALAGFNDEQFGILAGVGVHDSAQAIASGFIYSADAGGIATIVKLTRTAFLVPVLLGIGVFMNRRAASQAGPDVRGAVPWFAFGFVALAGVRTLGDAAVADTDWWSGLLSVATWVASFLIVVAMAGVGLQTDLAKLKHIGMRPFLVGLGAALAVALLVFVSVAL